MPCPDDLLSLDQEEVWLPHFDADRAWERAEREADLQGKHLYGVVSAYEVNLAPDHSGESAVSVHFPGVQGLALHFADFHLPVGVRMWVTNEAGTWQDGPYDFRDNDGHGRLATGDVPGDVAVIRLDIPQGLEQEVRLLMEGAAGLFRDVSATRGGSEPCQVDVACPEIEGWECQRDATVRLSIIESGGAYLWPVFRQSDQILRRFIPKSDKLRVDLIMRNALSMYQRKGADAAELYSQPPHRAGDRHH